MSNRDNHRPSSMSLRSPSSSQSSRNVAQQDYKVRMSVYSNKMGKDDKNGSELRASSTDEESTDNSETGELVQLLALQVYHLPGNNCPQDWWQFMVNNHPVFGICCHNNAHPIKARTRVVALIGTITFGLAMTNLFYLFFLWNPEYDRVLASITTDNGTELLLTTGMLLLWTVGSSVHSMFNLAMWHIAACACCRSGGCFESYACCPSFGKHMIRFFVLCTVGFCVMIILLRVAINDQEQEDSNADDGSIDRGIDILLDDQLELNVENVSQFTFLLTYLVEMVLALFVYYPIGGTILFSGILACGFKIPLLGGRPYEMTCEERRNSRRQGASSTLRSNVDI